MKVLFLTNLPAPYRVEFFTRLGEKCDLTVLFERKLSSNRDTSWRTEEKFRFRAIFLDGINVNHEDALCFNVVKYLKKGIFDLIIVCGYTTPTSILALNYCKIKKIKYILSIDGAIDKHEDWLLHLVKTMFIKGASAYLCTGKESKSFLINHGANEKKIYIYPFTSLSEAYIDKTTFLKRDKDILREELGIKEDKIIITVGQYIHRKGFDVLLNAIDPSRVDIGVYIIGGSQPISEYLEIIEKRKLKNIHFVSFQKKSQLIKYYHASDVFVLPTREDIWGLVINEAMACGLPIITTTRCVAGIELIKPGENGFLVEVDRVDELASRIVELLDSEASRIKMANNNLKKIKGYTLEKMAEIHYAIFRHIQEANNSFNE